MPTYANAAAPEFLIVAQSGRALAAAARRAGHRVAVIDFYGDDDTRRLASTVLRVEGDPAHGFDPAALMRAVAAFPSLPLVSGSGFEGDPDLLRRIARGRRLLGSPPAAIRLLKDPRRFARLLARLGVPHPAIRLDPPEDQKNWLARRAGAAGGWHIAPATRRHDRMGVYYQRIAPGRPVSVAFVADGRRARAIDLSDQWSDPTRAEPFRYGGAVASATIDRAVARRLVEAAEAAAGAGGAVGLGSADFLVDDQGGLMLLEINPRAGATLDLLDRHDPPKRGTAFARHLRACNGHLPGPFRFHAGRATAAAIVYSTRGARVPRNIRWPNGAADLSPPGARFPRGAPICTVIAGAATPRGARAAVDRKTLAVRARLDYA